MAEDLLVKIALVLRNSRGEVIARFIKHESVFAPTRAIQNKNVKVRVRLTMPVSNNFSYPAILRG